MKKINSENLWKFVNDLATNQKVKFKVFYNDNYVTEILWNGDYFEWEEGTFTSEGFFNPLYDFIVIEEDNDKTDEEAKPITKESIEALGYACGELQKCFTNGWTKALENKSLKDNDKLEKININDNGTLGFPNGCWTARNIDKAFAIRINGIIDHINKIEEKLDER